LKNLKGLGDVTHRPNSTLGRPLTRAGATGGIAGERRWRRSARLGAGLHYGLFLFTRTLTLWIGEPLLAAAGFLIHDAPFLVPYLACVRRAVVLTEEPSAWRDEAGPVATDGSSFTSWAGREPDAGQRPEEAPVMRTSR